MVTVCCNAQMKNVADIRRANLQLLVDRDGLASVARRAGKPDRQINDMLAGRKSFGEKVAREIELNIHPAMKPGWLDVAETVRYELPPDYPLSPAVPAKPRALEDDAIPVRMHHVPVVGTTQGGPTTRVWTDGDLPVGDGMGWVSVSSRDRNAFALRVEGSSMAPRYEHGEYVLVEPNRRPEPGDDVIVRLCGGECMIKRLSARRPHELAFDSLSPGYDRITVAPDQIEYLYYVAAGLRAGSYVRHIQADGYVGPERRWHDEPVSVKKRSGDQA